MNPAIITLSNYGSVFGLGLDNNTGLCPASHGTLCRPGAAASIDADEFELICHTHSIPLIFI